MGRQGLAETHEKEAVSGCDEADMASGADLREEFASNHKQGIGVLIDSPPMASPPAAMFQAPECISEKRLCRCGFIFKEGQLQVVCQAHNKGKLVCFVIMVQGKIEAASPQESALGAIIKPVGPIELELQGKNWKRLQAITLQTTLFSCTNSPFYRLDSGNSQFPQQSCC